MQVFLGLRVLARFLGPSDPKARSSEGFGLLLLAEGHLSIVTAGSQKCPLLVLPGHTVAILGMGLAQMGCQGEGGLLRVRARILLKHSDGIVSTCCSLGTRQLAPSNVIDGPGVEAGQSAHTLLAGGRATAHQSLLVAW